MVRLLPLLAALPAAARAAAPGAPLKAFFGGRSDNLVGATAATFAEAAEGHYEDINTPPHAPNDGIIASNASSAAPPGTVRLQHWHSAARGDSLTCSSAAALASAKQANYTYVRDEGFVYAKATGAAQTPLVLYYSAGRQDHFLVAANSVHEKDALQVGYVKQSVEGYCVGNPPPPPPPPPAWTAWPSEVPKGGDGGGVSPFEPSAELTGFEYWSGEPRPPPPLRPRACRGCSLSCSSATTGANDPCSLKRSVVGACVPASLCPRFFSSRWWLRGRGREHCRRDRSGHLVPELERLRLAVHDFHGRNRHGLRDEEARLLLLLRALPQEQRLVHHAGPGHGDAQQAEQPAQLFRGGGRRRSALQLLGAALPGPLPVRLPLFQGRLVATYSAKDSS